MADLFRKKSLERLEAPEELNDYIRVTTPSVWMVLLAAFILVAGILVWSIFGTVSMENDDGTTEYVHPITFVTN